MNGQAYRWTGGCAAALLGLLACSAPPRSNGRLLAATIAPLGDLLSRVAGPTWEVRTIVPPGTSPHVFEPLPRDVARIAETKLLFSVGAGYDGWAARLVQAAAADAVVLDGAASAGVHASGREEDEGRAGTDPHWWLAPLRARRTVAPLVARLAAIDPAGAAGYRERGGALETSLDRLDSDLARLLAPVKGRAFVSTHAAWVYFAEAYGLREVASIETVPGREPSPGAILGIIRTARAEGMSTLFTEPQFPPGAAAVVAREAGLGVALLDPIGGVPGREGYDATLRFDAAQLARGLGRRT